MIPSAGMHDQSCRLVQDKQIIILEKNFERHLLRLGFDFLKGRFGKLDEIVRPDKIPRAGRFSIQRDESLRESTFADARREKSGQFQSQEPIQPEPAPLPATISEIMARRYIGRPVSKGTAKKIKEPDCLSPSWQKSLLTGHSTPAKQNST